MTDEPKGPVAAELARTRHLPYESARMLAILPRVKYYNESTAAAFAGTIAALPSAANSVRADPALLDGGGHVRITQQVPYA